MTIELWDARRISTAALSLRDFGTFVNLMHSGVPVGHFVYPAARD